LDKLATLPATSAGSAPVRHPKYCAHVNTWSQSGEHASVFAMQQTYKADFINFEKFNAHAT
jgi:uncharacterized protein YcsI (UPF0317 family)